jgi:Cellulose-binding Sde182, nucleoside hydrolase-like domain/Cellulose-binding protein Sde0182, C-terminal domain
VSIAALQSNETRAASRRFICQRTTVRRVPSGCYAPTDSTPGDTAPRTRVPAVGAVTAGATAPFRGLVVRWSHSIPIVVVWSLLAGCAAGNGVGAQGDHTKPRVVVTSDGELDDVDSFIRFLLYANEFQVEGLVYSSSEWHYAGDGKGTLFTSEMPFPRQRYGERTDLRWPGTTWMEELIGAYGEVYDNLLLHDPGYPNPDSLLSLVRVGNIDFEGEMDHDTPGSDLIEQVLLDDDPEPVYLMAWGGTNTIARALESIEDTYKSTPQWQDVHARVSAKAVIYIILDQDMTYRRYIAPNWPDVKILYNTRQFGALAYWWPQVVPAELQTHLNGSWYSEHIRFDHGPLLEKYYLWGDGRQVPNDFEHTHGSLEETRANGRTQYDFISEGDSPSFFDLIDVGLRNLEHASWGGWGGRLVRSDSVGNRWEDERVTDHNPYTDSSDASYPQVRWIDVMQNDFAARADWCVMSYDSANHAPAVTLQGTGDATVAPGSQVQLNGAATDPDGDAVSFRWWQYTDVDTYPGEVMIANASSQHASFTVPQDAAAGQTIHIILEVTDAGAPPLTRYQRVVFTVGE